MFFILRIVLLAGLIGFGSANVQAQGINPAGQWSCKVNHIHLGVATATVFNVDIAADGRFAAAGLKGSPGSGNLDHGSAPFQAHGTWKIIPSGSGDVFVMDGVHAGTFPTPFSFASVVRDQKLIAGDTQNTTTRMVTSCER